MTGAAVAGWCSELFDLVLVGWLLAAAFAGYAISQWQRARANVASERESRQFLELLSEASIAMTYVFDVEKRALVYWNRSCAEFLGLAADKCLAARAADVSDILHPEDKPLHAEHVAELADLADGGVLHFEPRWRHASGEWRWVGIDECVMARNGDGCPKLILGTGQDMTERRAVEQAIRHSKEILDRLIDQAAVGMAMVAPDGHFLRVNESLCEFLGYYDFELLEMDFQTITHPDDLEKDLNLVAQMLAGEIKTYSMEKRYFQKNGQTVWAMLNVSLMRDADDKPMYFLSQVADINERKAQEKLLQDYSERLEAQTHALDQANQQLRELASVDGLTGVFNRRALNEHLASAVEGSIRTSEPLSLILLDVDHFKSFNDVYGHAAGDDALRSVAKVLKSCARECDLVARYGGEEFVLVCSNTTLDQATDLANGARRRLSEIKGLARSLTASFGVSTLIGSQERPEDLTAKADEALYLAKGAGRNCVRTENDRPAAKSA